MPLDRVACIDDLRRIAKKRVPRFAFDLLDGGAENESNLRRNRDALDAIRIVPRYLVNVSERSLETQLFGTTYAVPFGIAPIGLLNVFWPGADLILARLAARERIPIVASAAASTTLEAIAAAAEGYAWFQLYVSSDADINASLLARARTAGYQVLMVTVDVPVPGKRDRDIRNGLRIPFRMTSHVLADLVMHPRWCLATLAAGRPIAANYAATMGAAGSMAAVQEILTAGLFDWDELKRLRDNWQGPLLVKGILHPEDAVRCVEVGCDGVVVSNHGGRQIGYGPASIETMPLIANAVDGAVPVLMDSGVRRGADIIRAKALGADFVLLGRAFGFGVGAGGAAGARRAFDIIELELSRALCQIGRPDFATVDDSVLASYRSDAGHVPSGSRTKAPTLPGA